MAFGRAKVQYDDSDERAYLPIYTHELDDLINDGMKDIASSRDKLMHFAARVRLTLQSDRDKIMQQNTQIQQLQVVRSTNTNRGGSLNPRDALKYLPPEEIAAAVDRYYEQKIIQVQKLVDDVKGLRAKASAEATLLRATRFAVIDDELLDDETRARLLKASESSVEQEDIDAPLIPPVPEITVLPVFEAEEEETIYYEETPDLGDLFPEEEQ